MTTVAVIGAGVAGCAAAVAAAEAGARVVLIEAARHLGGVAARGEHRTICGLAPIDALMPELLEPDLVEPWIAELTTGAPYRQGRVWLWPTTADTLQAGLARRVAGAGVELRRGAAVASATLDGGAVRSLEVAGLRLAVDQVVDASGVGALAGALGLPLAAAEQWGAFRALLRADIADRPAARVRALGLAQAAAESSAALALTPAEGGHWQLSLDVARGTSAAVAARAVERIAAALQAEVVACATRVAERDEGRPLGELGLEELFAERERGLCWAAWPREEHRGGGVAWTWPPRDRHGVPERATRAAGAPLNCRFVGKGMPVAPAAAAALRVTGTCLALGAAAGRAAALAG